MDNLLKSLKSDNHLIIILKTESDGLIKLKGTELKQISNKGLWALTINEFNKSDNIQSQIFFRSENVFTVTQNAKERLK